MDLSYAAYVGYGVLIPVDPYERNDKGMYPDEAVDQILSVGAVRSVCPDVGHLTATTYPQNMFFLVTQCDSAELGEYTRFTRDNDTGSWDWQLDYLVQLMGWSGFDIERPSWFVVSNVY